MAEERDVNQEAQQPENGGDAAAEAAAPKKKKKKKKTGKLTILFWLLILGIGTAVGLHFSGLWDGRPLFWSIMPQIPYAGEYISKFFDIPAEYSLTPNERRSIELADWQKRLDAKERELTSLDYVLGMSSRDLDYQMRTFNAQRQNAAASDGESSGLNPTAEEQELMNQIARTYQDMSARNAAAIVEQLRDALAVDLLMKLPNDARASILGKVRPTKAARLTELMSRPRR